MKKHYNFIFLFLSFFLTFLVPANYALAALASDVQVGDPRVGYFNHEFSPDMNFMSWQETNTNGRIVNTWICQVDPDTANLIPSDGKGISFPNIPGSASPQWGVDKKGEFLIALDRRGRGFLSEWSFILRSTRS